MPIFARRLFLLLVVFPNRLKYARNELILSGLDYLIHFCIFKYMKKPKRLILGYEMKLQVFGGFKIVEYSQMDNGEGFRKRTLHKNLDLSTAEDIIYRLENKK